MDSRFCNFMISVLIPLSLVFLSACQPESSAAEPPVQSGVLEAKSPEKVVVKEPNVSPEKVVVKEPNVSPEKVVVKESNVSPEEVVVKEPNVSGPAPNIKFDKLVHDFCDVSPDSENTCTFGFTNTGPGALQITQTSGTCKCTVPDLKKKDYAPGESGELGVQFHAPVYQGQTSQHVFVSTNDPNNPKVELTVRAYVRLKVQVTPETMKLSLIDPNNAGAVAVTIKSLDNERFAITKIDSPGEVFTVDFDPNNISDTHILYPKVNLENLRRYLSSSIIMEINHPACRTVRVTYTCPKEFETSPSRIIIRDAVIGEVQKRIIYLISNYNQPIEIESVTSDKGVIKVISQEKTEGKFQFNVEVTPPSKEGQLKIFSDVLHIKIKDKEQLDVLCHGFYKPGP